MHWLGLLALVLALIGYNGSLRYLGVSPYLAWITAIAWQIIWLYVFAMLGALRWGIFIVTGVGVGLFIIRTVASFFGYGRLQFEGFHLFDFWMVGLGLAMGNVLYHSPLIHYDNFSHWATMVKFMTFEGRLPGVHDTIIQFTSYPPATALWLTQWATLVGFNDGVLLVVQFILIWAAAYSVFALLRDRSRALLSLTLCFTIALSFVFNIAIRLNNLLVDYVLPLLTVAALVGIFVYRRRPALLLGHTTLFIAVLLLVKNSAAFYVALIAGALLVTLVRHSTAHTRWQRVLHGTASWLGVVLVGAAPFFWWSRHVKQTFPVSKHEISAQAYAHQLTTDGPDKLLKIGRHMLQQLNWTSLSFEGVLLINAVLIITWLVLRLFAANRTNLLKVALGLDLMFVGYFASLYGMYGLSMPYLEAMHLDGYERYMSSIVILGLFLAAMAFVRALDRSLFEQRIAKRDLRSFASVFTKNLYQMSTFILMIFAIILMLSEINGTQFTNRYNRETVPRQLARIAKPVDHYNHTKILVVDPHAGDVDDYYVGFVAHYYFFTDRADGQENFMESPAQFRKQIQRYQYVAIPEYHHTFTVMMQHAYHQKGIRTGMYRVVSGGLKRV